MIDFDTLFEGREFARTRYEQLIPKLKVILEVDDADVSIESTPLDLCDNKLCLVD